MRIRIEAVRVVLLGSDPEKHSIEITEEQFVKAAHDHWWSLPNRPKQTDYYFQQKFGDDFLMKLVGLDKLEYGPQIVAQRSPSRINTTYCGASWFAVNWYRDHRVVGEEECGFAFMWRDCGPTNPVWRYFSIPAECSIDPWKGDLTVRSYKSNELFYPALVEPWPEPMKSPYVAPSLGILNRLLKAEDENPLTMLACAGHQPCKGAAKQVINAIKKAQQLLIHDPVER